jgi:signal peptidase I
MTTLFLWVILLAVNFLVYAIFLWVGGRLAKAKRATIFRALAATALIWIFGSACLALTLWLNSLHERQEAAMFLLAAIGVILAQIIIAVLIIQLFLQTSFWRAGLVWLFGVIASAAGLALALLVVRVYVMEAFIVPTNAMAPTLIGWHKTATCPHCGQTMIVPAPSPEDRANALQMPPDKLGMCSNCFKSGEPVDTSSDTLSPDRFMVNKLLTPQRWDIIVFRYPNDPSLKYVFRVIGLPGEEVLIKDGAIWVNGTKQTRPESIASLKYSAEDEGGSGIQFAFGPPDRPWRLKDDEFCVLGDFPLLASDSRMWGPVPRANIEGVATVRYWPISRWQVWR